MARPLPSRVRFSRSEKGVCIDSSLNCPPRQRLAYPLCDEQPIVRQLVRRLGIGVGHRAFVEIVAVDLYRMGGIEFRRNDLCFFLITKSRPAALPVPVLADLLTIVELDFHFDRHYEIFFAMK